MKWALSSLAVFLLVSSGAAKTHPGDTAALKLLKAAVDPTSISSTSCLSTWDFTSSDPCDSISSSQFTCGFRCDFIDAEGIARVTEISLDAAGYSGTLSSSIWSLPYLRTLDVSDNRLSGSIPSSSLSSDVRQLRRISLSRNAFSGEIQFQLPAVEFPLLTELYLDGNAFSGPLPEAISELGYLQRLELQMNNFSGGLPDLTRLKNLTYFDVSDNAISGSLPLTLSPNIVAFAARNNSLQSFLPSSVFTEISSLQVLDLSYNKLSGQIPAALFLLPALQQVGLSHNEFTSLEVNSAAPPGGLVAVDMGYNKIRGRLPVGWMRKMPKLAALSMEENMLTGFIPVEYAARVAGARVSGGVAAEEAQLSRLLLAGNYFYGPVPAPLTAVKEGDAILRLGDNCLAICPTSFFFCRGRGQKLPSVCRHFDPFIP